MDFGKDDWEGLEPDIQNTVDQSDVKVQQENDRLCETELKRSNKSLEQNIHGSSLLNLNLGF